MNEDEKEEQKEEKLELVFGTEKLLESAKENFVGEVIYAEFPCHCEDCEKGATAMLEKLQREAPERLHIHIKPLTVYTEVQHNWWIPTKTKLSRWGALQEQLEKLGIINNFKTEREKAFMGIVAEWQWSEVAVGVTGDAKFHWLPIRLLTEDEIAGIGSAKPSESSASGKPSEPSSGDRKEGDSEPSSDAKLD